jgi:hypothetical protein
MVLNLRLAIGEIRKYRTCYLRLGESSAWCTKCVACSSAKSAIGLLHQLVDLICVEKVVSKLLLLEPLSGLLC